MADLLGDLDSTSISRLIEYAFSRYALPTMKLRGLLLIRRSEA